MNVFIKIGLFALLAVATSCVSNKEMVYIQGVDTTYHRPQPITQNFALTIQPDDELAITVTSKNKELIGIFDTQIQIGRGAGGGIIQHNPNESLAYFLVDKDGTITFPIFGRIQAAGRTPSDLSADIQERMVRGNYINDASVKTRIMSFKVTVLGDVRNPGTQSHTGQRLTILEALGRAGDLNHSAIRTNVIVMREEEGKRVAYKVDLTNTNAVFESPAYYLQQNDLVYVESNKSVKVKGSTSYAYMGIAATLVGLASSITALVITLTR